MSKVLTVENWNRHDTQSAHLVLVDRQGVERTPTGDGWVERILKPQLNGTIPGEVAEMFEVARGILVYGWFYYPLFTAGAEKMYFVIETAVSDRCSQLRAPKGRKTFKQKIDWMFEKHHLTEAEFKRLDASRSLRNMAAHREKGCTYDPSWAVDGVYVAAGIINELFPTGDENL